ncbi:flavodoxin [Longibacter salinarum]|uniref:Flavodoxin n=1 Tax=Longibacter salinarum TaxID=1850348 RepID=A0A2A8CX70_9BACT|nr:NAD(P)H-dependent oxidoreductase [Longibacter salinarum]PEN13302.1 flavodoxin [Longibacter salinarum]
MQNVLIINGHQPYPFAEGRLNGTFVSIAREHLEARGDTVRLTEVAGGDGWDVEEEVENHQWADVVLMQFPVNWMSMPWSLKKYMDEVYTAGMDGRMCNGDGRHGPDENHQYGLGGTLTNTAYMLSLTFNAPRDAFDTSDAPFFDGRSVDDLLNPMHLNCAFFGMTKTPTFSAHDVMKNPDIETDIARFKTHLDRHFPPHSNEEMPVTERATSE